MDTRTMKNGPHRKNCNSGVVEKFVGLPMIPPIKSKRGDKSDEYLVKLKFHRDPTSEKSYFCDLNGLV